MATYPRDLVVLTSGFSVQDIDNVQRLPDETGYVTQQKRFTLTRRVVTCALDLLEEDYPDFITWSTGEGLKGFDWDGLVKDENGDPVSVHTRIVGDSKRAIRNDDGSWRVSVVFEYFI